LKDNAQAIGASYKGSRAGSLGEAAASAFIPQKILAPTATPEWVRTNSRNSPPAFEALAITVQSEKYRQH